MTELTGGDVDINVGGKTIFEEENEIHESYQSKQDFGRDSLTGALRGAGLGVASGAVVISGSFVWQSLFAPTACAIDGTCTEEDVVKQAQEKIEQNKSMIENANTDETERTRLEEENRLLVNLVQGIETGTINCTNTACYPKYDNMYDYALDENGNPFQPPVACRNGKCTQLGKGDDRITVTPDDNGDYYINGVKVGTDENGNIVTYPSAGYISATGRYDVISIGSVHWSALSDDKRGGGLGDLLREAGKAEKGSAAHDFYDEYIAIMGVDSAGKPNINNSDILATPGAIDAIRTLTNNYMSNEEFKNFENGVIRNNYFETPVKRFPLDIQARMNNSDNAVQQVLVSTFVQLGSDGDKVLREAFELFPDDDFAAMEYAINGLSSNSLKGPDRAAKELEFLNQYKK